MCGIYFSYNLKNINEKVIKKSLIHRGPDAYNSLFLTNNDYNIFMAHSRLKIIDLSEQANQPMFEDNIYLIFNGEIFNYKELRKEYGLICKTESDTEVILLMYKKFKEEFFKYLDGMFSIVILDLNRKIIVFGRDKMGEKPLYLYLDRSRKILILSSKIQTILYSTDYMRFRLNYQSIYDLLTFSFIPEDNTIFDDILSCKRGHYYIYCITTDKLTEKKIDFIVPKFNKKNLIKTTKELVEENIFKRSQSDVKIGTFLSGGLDSSIVSILLARKFGRIETFSVGFEDNYDPYHNFSDESYYSNLVSRYIYSKHYSFIIREKDFLSNLENFVLYADQPFGSPSAIGLLVLSKIAQENGVKVLISGDGADELFGGYKWHLKVRFNNQLNVFYYKPKGWHYYCFDEEKRFFLNKEVFGSCNPSKRFLILNWKTANPKEFIDIDREFYLANEMMVKLDRMTMALGVEGRAGFISNKLVKFAEMLTYKEVFPKNEAKYLLKMAFRDILPNEILHREKHGFNIPLIGWIKNKGDFYQLVRYVVDSKDSLLVKESIITRGDRFLELLERNPERLSVTAFALIVLNRFLEITRKKVIM